MDSGTADSERVLRQADSLFEAGEWRAAAARYRAVLALDPKNPRAYERLGTALLRAGVPNDAVATLNEALSVDPESAPLHKALGNAQVALGQMDAAAASYRKALKIDPRYVDARFNLAYVDELGGDLEHAAAGYREVLALDPRLPDAHNNLGIVLQELGRAAEAIPCYEAAIALRPGYAEAHNNLANLLRGQGRQDLALEHYRAAAEFDPDSPVLLYNLGEALRAAGRNDAAADAYRKATSLQPEFAEGWDSLGIALHALGREAEAVSAYETALRVRPEFAHALANLAASLHALGENEQAAASCRRALAIDPGLADAHGNLGSALVALGRHAEALPSFEEAAELAPQSAGAAYNVGTALRELGRPQEAVVWFRRAQSLDPDHVEAHLSEAFARLALGDFAGGWPKYEWRWQRAVARASTTDLPGARWTGAEALEGKTIFLFSEQGLGDALQFVRYAPLVAARGARVVLEAHPWVAGLLSGVRGVDELVVQGRSRPRCDFHCSLMSLPLAFGTDADTIPHEVPYLTVPEDKRAAWRSRLQVLRSPRVGFVWSSSAPGAGYRCLALRDLLPALGDPGIQFVSLQKEVHAPETELLRSLANVVQLGPEFADYGDTAAVIEQLDLVVSIDTSVAHAAGALAKPTWIMLPFRSEWRWVLGRDDSPWYPSVRLFRQQQRGDWGAVVERLARSLAERFAQPTA